MELVKDIDTSKLKILFRDGPVFRFLNLTFQDNKATISEKFKSKYACIYFLYPNSLNITEGRAFFVTDKPAKILFQAVSDPMQNKLSLYKLINVLDFKEECEKVNLYAKTTEEQTEIERLKKLVDVSQNDSISELYNRAQEKWGLKQLGYLKKHGDKYSSFLNFIYCVIPALKENFPTDLYEVFNSSFPKKFRDSYEGKSALEELKGKLFAKVGMQCPSFRVSDINGREISKKNLAGKCFILSFWATTCGPCVQEIPQLVAIRKKYAPDILEMISISHDTNSGILQKGIEKYKMNWTHISKRYEMDNLFGVPYIPVLYMVDRSGKIVFSSLEQDMGLLNEVLKASCDPRVK